MTGKKVLARLHVPDHLGAGATIGLAPGQVHYLRAVMRAIPGEAVALFNGRDGAWLAVIDKLTKNSCWLSVGEQTRQPAPEPDLWLLFAPVKGARIDWVAQRATELGVSRLLPVLTERTQVRRVNEARLLANAIEAAEQCERLSVPDVAETAGLRAVLAAWPGDRRLIVADETGAATPIAAMLAENELSGRPVAVLVGPEGGFSAGELDLLRELPFVTCVGLGPRVLRADTAAIALLAVCQALCGDWGCPRISD
ncbi:MAG: 16S rRNA (uracil(1498)-N(3))-methyltransferase [Alphaproteobacteria bacterium]